MGRVIIYLYHTTLHYAKKFLALISAPTTIEARECVSRARLLNLRRLRRKRAKASHTRWSMLFGDDDNIDYAFKNSLKTLITRDLNCTRIHEIVRDVLINLKYNYKLNKYSNKSLALQFRGIFIWFASGRKYISSNCEFNTQFAKAMDLVRAP